MGNAVAWAASDSTVQLTLDALDVEVMAALARARARVRRLVRPWLHLRPGGYPWLTVPGKRPHRRVVVAMDATIITASS